MLKQRWHHPQNRQIPILFQFETDLSEGCVEMVLYGTVGKAHSVSNFLIGIPFEATHLECLTPFRRKFFDHLAQQLLQLPMLVLHHIEWSCRQRSDVSFAKGILTNLVIHTMFGNLK